jgi:RNA polymerase-binding transcription factor DksA
VTDLPDSPEPNVEQPAPIVAEEEALPDLGGLGVIEAELDDVTRALERLDEGTYGTCEACGTTLRDEVLAASPAARRCAEHAA